MPCCDVPGKLARAFPEKKIEVNGNVYLRQLPRSLFFISLFGTFCPRDCVRILSTNTVSDFYIWKTTKAQQLYEQSVKTQKTY